MGCVTHTREPRFSSPAVYSKYTPILAIQGDILSIGAQTIGNGTLLFQVRFAESLSTFGANGLLF